MRCCLGRRVWHFRLFCGPEETRTPDFHYAIVTLYQLSYGPKLLFQLCGFFMQSVFLTPSTVLVEF
jgi:hypothetical protein